MKGDDIILKPKGAEAVTGNSRAVNSRRNASSKVTANPSHVCSEPLRASRHLLPPPPFAHRAGAAPHSAVAELGVVRPHFAICMTATSISGTASSFGASWLSLVLPCFRRWAERALHSRHRSAWGRMATAGGRTRKAIPMPDLRQSGDGGSQPCSVPITVEQMAEDARALMDAHGWDSAHVVGHSLGGLVALHLALSDRTRVRSLSLLCTFACGRDATRLSWGMFWLGCALILERVECGEWP